MKRYIVTLVLSVPDTVLPIKQWDWTALVNPDITEDFVRVEHEVCQEYNLE